MLRNVLVLLSAATLTACTSDGSSPQSSAAPTASPAVASAPGRLASDTASRPGAGRDGSRPPAVLEVVGPRVVRAGDDLHIVVHLLRDVPFSAPMHFSVAAPTGATVRQRLTSETITDATSTDITRAFDVHVESTPADDLVFALEAGDASFGVRAEARYRFGRAEPVLADVGPVGVPVGVKAPPRPHPGLRLNAP